jgi:hypothetical protein
MLFYWLLAAHCVGDWILQGRKMAYGKLTNVLTRVSHCALYTLVVSCILWLTQGSVFWYVIPYLIISHFIADTPAVKKWWVRHVLGGDVEKEPEWYWVGLDQAFHLVLLAPVMLVYSQ